MAFVDGGFSFKVMEQNHLIIHLQCNFSPIFKVCDGLC
nr:MAG TPA: hypothetical protein [Caudoviricetes sp.]